MFARGFSSRGGRGVSLAPIEASYVGLMESGTQLSTYTFSSSPLGAADANRLIAVGVSGVFGPGGSSRTVNSVTIAGVSATSIVKVSHDVASAYTAAAIFAAIVPNGTTGTISVVFNGAMRRCGCGIWRLLNADIVPHATIGDANGTPLGGSLEIPAGGAAVATAQATGGATSFNWTGLTEDWDEWLASSTYTSGAHSTTAGTAARQVSFTNSTAEAAVFASFAPK